MIIKLEISFPEFVLKSRLAYSNSAFQGFLLIAI